VALYGETPGTPGALHVPAVCFHPVGCRRQPPGLVPHTNWASIWADIVCRAVGSANYRA